MKNGWDGVMVREKSALKKWNISCRSLSAPSLPSFFLLPVTNIVLVCLIIWCDGVSSFKSLPT